jgi:hypothetical protein
MKKPTFGHKIGQKSKPPKLDKGGSMNKFTHLFRFGLCRFDDETMVRKTLQIPVTVSPVEGESDK